MKIPLLFALVGTLGVASWAQTSSDIIDPTLVITDGIITPSSQYTERAFKSTLKNVKPGLMAHWLDPSHHSLPIEFGGRPYAGRTNTVPLVDIASPRNPRPETFHLPKGVDRIVAVDPKNTLLVFGTPQGAARLALIIALLDKPMRQVEIEAQYISLSTQDTQKFVPNSSDATVQIWRGNFNSSLATLLNQHKAAVITAPRVLAVNNVKASLSRTFSQPVQITSTGKGASWLEAFEANGLSLETTQALEVTPTINNDDTVTLLAHVKRSVQLKNSGSSDSLVLEEDPSQEIIANVRDGETFALMQKQTPEQAKASQRIVLLITTRIVRRTDN